MKNSRLTFFIFAAAAILAVAGALHSMLRLARPGPVDQVRVEERLRILEEVRATNDYVLHEYAWQNQPKGIIRLPIDQAKDLVVREWQNPALGRSNLLARAAKAFAPAPKAAEIPNPYE